MARTRRVQIITVALVIVASGAHMLSANAVAAAPLAPPVLTGALSCKTHGSAGTFDLALGLPPANPTTEPRQGPTHAVVFVFDKAVIEGTPSVTEGTALTGAATFNGSETIVPLTGVANQQYVRVDFTGVRGADLSSGGSGSVRIGFLLSKNE